MNSFSQGVRGNPVLQRAFFILFGLFCLTPWGSPPIALLLGFVLAIVFGNPLSALSKPFTTMLLQVSVVGLGFAINLDKAFVAGKNGILYTVGSIAISILLGLLIGKWLTIEKKISYLISCGTAICGGSAIAAIAPIIKAEKEQISVALGTVFILNSVALLLFPFIGHYFAMQPHEFGLWAAIAIHDTSSVVGTASHFGTEALEYATTVKLLRALWIIPLAFVTAYFYKNKSASVKPPYFIGFFVLAMLVSTYFPGFSAISPVIVSVAKKGLTLTLFLIGTSLSKSTLKAVGIKPFLQGCCLWIIISVVSLLLILSFR